MLDDNHVDSESRDSFTQTPETLTENTPRKIKLRKRLTKLKNNNNYLKRKIKHIQEKKELTNMTRNQFIEICYKFLPDPAAKFFEAQVLLQNSRNYPDDYKQLCLAIYFSGPKAYDVLKNVFKLPCRRTLRRMTEIDLPEGMSPFQIAALQAKVASFSNSDKVKTYETLVKNFLIDLKL